MVPPRFTTLTEVRLPAPSETTTGISLIRLDPVSRGNRNLGCPPQLDAALGAGWRRIARELLVESLTLSILLAGTPEYMSPEQASGLALSAASD
jgi:hypothetical protein